MAFPLLFAIGKVAFSAAAPAVADAFAKKMASMRQTRQQKRLIGLYKYAAATNELVNRVRYLADPSTSEDLRKSMERHAATFDREGDRTQRLREETIAAQKQLEND